MKRPLGSLLAVTILLVSFCAHAQDANPVDPERRAAADKLLRLFKIDENMNAAFDQVEKMQMAIMDKQAPSGKGREAATKAMEESMKAYREEFTWDKIGGMFVDIYAEIFTKEELDDLAKFYESPIGRKFIEKQPQLQAATMKRMQTMIMELMPKINAQVKAAVESAGKDAPKE